VITEVDYYGLHSEGSVTWLVQGRKGSNFVGLKAYCPFQTTGGMCNHMVPTAAPVPDRVHWDNWMRVFNDPLVQAMLPIPKPLGQNLFYVDDPYDDLGFYLATLSRLSSPIKQIIKPTWLLKAKALETELQTSNIQPLVLVQTDQKSQAIVDTIGKLALYMPRPVIFTGKSEVVVHAPIQRIKTQIRDFELTDLMMLPLENIGAAMIRRYARNEELDAPWETREDRRNRQIRERS
jgi:hypothetical protein